MNDAKQTLLADRKLFLSWVKLQQIRMSDLLRYAVLVMSKFSTAIGVDFRGGTKRGTAVLGLGSTGLGFQLVLVPQSSSPTLFCTNSAFHKVVW